MKILITGGASGLGEAITKKLASDEKNIIYFTYCNSQSNANALETGYSNVKSIQCDFKNSDEIVKLLALIPGFELDLLINNALTGMAKKHFTKTEPSIFVSGFIENILPVISITQKCIEAFKTRKSGKIITILSDALIGNPPLGMSEYTAEKAYLFSLCKSWAVESIKHGITSNCISPSTMNTGLHKNVDERIMEQIKENNPLKRLLTTEEVADAVNFLVNCSYQINGINIVMNGGERVL